MQGDPENDTGNAGVQKRPDANTDAERRGPDRAADGRVFDRQRGDRIQRGKPGRDLRVDRAAAGGSGVHGAEQGAAGRDPEVCEQSNGAEPAADHAADPKLRTDGQGGTEGKPAVPVSGEVHGAGCDVAGGNGSGARTAQRTGDATHSAARARRIRQGGICATGGDFGLAHLQPAEQPEVPEAGGSIRADAAQREFNRRAAPSRTAGPSGLPAGGHGASGGTGTA
jgi:hypothetical protein